MAGLVPAIHAKHLRNGRKARAVDEFQLASRGFVAGLGRGRRNVDITRTFREVSAWMAGTSSLASVQLTGFEERA
jgi:hypothetical protein